VRKDSSVRSQHGKETVVHAPESSPRAPIKFRGDEARAYVHILPLLFSTFLTGQEAKLLSTNLSTNFNTKSALPLLNRSC
jgi:hypothetical protein